MGAGVAGHLVRPAPTASPLQIPLLAASITIRNRSSVRMSALGKANAALAAALIFLLLSTCAAYISFSRLHRSEQWVHHTRDVQSAMAQFETFMGQAARTRTDFAYSGDLSVLPRYAERLRQVRSTVDLIQRLTIDNAAEQLNCQKLRDLSEQRIALMDGSIDMKRSGNSSLETQVGITRQIVTMSEATDALLQRMDDAEDQLLAQREARVQASATTTMAVLLTSLFLALVLFIVHHQLLTGQVRARARAETTQRTLNAKLLTLQDEERRKFARELHDSVGQHLAAMKMGISILQTKLPGDTMLQDCIKLLDDSISETRTISHLLHPPLLDEAGLNSASRWFVEGFAKRSGIEINLDIQDETERLSESIELVLFRVLQESLTNIHRHSGSTKADVSLRMLGDNAVLRIRDYGRGISPAVVNTLREDGSGGGVGLAGMTERIRETGGKLEIHSAPDGTEIVARVPIRRRPKRPDISPITQQQEVRG